MYGLVNKAVEQMVCSSLGLETWQLIKQRAGVDSEVFVSMHSYSDDVTYRLVEAASAILGHSQADILRSFGRYWTLYTVKEGYGDLLALTGSSLWAFLQNLDSLHARIGLSYPHLRPPSFSCSDMTPHSMLLHYYSEREGLAPMVVGLLEGLAERFQTPITIALVQSRGAGDDHDVFHLTQLEHNYDHR